MLFFVDNAPLAYRGTLLGVHTVYMYAADVHSLFLARAIAFVGKVRLISLLAMSVKKVELTVDRDQSR